MVEMDFASVSDLFAENKTSSPFILWEPTVYDFTHPVIKSFAKCLMGTNTKATSLTVAQFEACDVEPALPWFMLLEPNDDGSDFRYLKYGSDIEAVYGRT